jgi:hypothetical protein
VFSDPCYLEEGSGEGWVGSGRSCGLVANSKPGGLKPRPYKTCNRTYCKALQGEGFVVRGLGAGAFCAQEALLNSSDELFTTLADLILLV